jgi:phosphatidylinositol alpha-1,6-mannosyltransferase
MKILFISHTYPPIKGGVETHNYELFTWLSKISQTKLIVNTHGRKFLPLFAPYAIVKTLWLLPKYDVVLLGSGMLSIIGWTVKLFSKKPVVSVVHGLDINYNSASLGVWYEKVLIFIYQSLWTKVFLPKLDKFIAVGNETIKVGIEAGIPREKMVFIPNGIDTEKYFAPHAHEELEKILGISLTDKYVLLTSGRLAKRKGVAWFIRNVLPKLDEKILYTVAGDGPDKQNVLDAIKENGLEKRVFVLGRVSDEVRDTLFNTCDLFIQPNIKIAGDMEGFGISVIEAVSCQIPVIVSELEGLKDAIKDGENGFLVEPENPDAYISKINSLLVDEIYRKSFGEKARNYVLDNYQWENIAKRYAEEIRSVLKNKNPV